MRIKETERAEARIDMAPQQILQGLFHDLQQMLPAGIESICPDYTSTTQDLTDSYLHMDYIVYRLNVQRICKATQRQKKHKGHLANDIDSISRGWPKSWRIKDKEFPFYVPSLLESLQEFSLSSEMLSHTSVWQDLSRSTCIQDITLLRLHGLDLTCLLEEICFLPKLKELDAVFNRLVTLPPQIENLRSSLQKLSLNHNRLRVFPVQIGQLTELTELWANDNRLEELPLEICDLNHLRCLFLDWNCLQSIPLGIGKLTNLEALRLSYNQLKSLPSETKQLVHLEELGLKNNPLEKKPPIEKKHFPKLRRGFRAYVFGKHDQRETCFGIDIWKWLEYLVRSATKQSM